MSINLKSVLCETNSKHLPTITIETSTLQHFQEFQFDTRCDWSVREGIYWSVREGISIGQILFRSVHVPHTCVFSHVKYCLLIAINHNLPITYIYFCCIVVEHYLKYTIYLLWRASFIVNTCCLHSSLFNDTLLITHRVFSEWRFLCFARRAAPTVNQLLRTFPSCFKTFATSLDAERQWYKKHFITFRYIEYIRMYC